MAINSIDDHKGNFNLRVDKEYYKYFVYKRIMHLCAGILNKTVIKI